MQERLGRIDYEQLRSKPIGWYVNKPLLNTIVRYMVLLLKLAVKVPRI